MYGATRLGGAGWGAVFSLPAPHLAIRRLSLAGANVLIDATNGVAGQSCVLLTSTNLALPAAQWTPATTNVLAAGGGFSLSATDAATPGAPSQFYRLLAQ